MRIKTNVVYRNRLTGDHAEVVTLAKDAQTSAFNDVVVYRMLNKHFNNTYVLDADEFVKRFHELKILR